MSEGTAVPHGRARLGGYSRWIVSDYVMQRASIPVAFLVVFGGLWLYVIGRQAGPARQIAAFQQFAHAMYLQQSAIFLALGGFLATVAVMSVDRSANYFRFYFAKPVTPVTYYGWTFLLHGVGFVGIFTLFAALWGDATSHESLRAAAAVGALTFLLFGGVSLLAGALSNFDIAITPLVSVVALSFQLTVFAPDVGLRGFPAWMVFTARVLPPVGALQVVSTRLLAAGTWPGAGDLWHIVLYGGVCFALGLVALRLRSLQR